MSKFNQYFLMNLEDVTEYAREKLDIFAADAKLQAAEIGDGNINYVFKVWENPSGKSVIIKQAGPTARISDDFVLSTDRIRIESELLMLEDKLAPGLVPKVYKYDDVMGCCAMEDLSDYVIMRDALMEHQIFPRFADDIIAFLNAMKIAPVHLVGISMGGMIAFQIGVTAPKLLKSMVIVNSIPALRIQSPKDYLMVWQRLGIVRLLGMRKMGQFIGDRLFPKPEQTDLREIFTDRWAKNNKKAYLNAMRGLINWDVTEQLHRITCPVLVVAADKDYTPISEKETYTAKLPHAELIVIPDSRHATPVEKPDIFNEIVHTFLKQHT